MEAVGIKVGFGELVIELLVKIVDPPELALKVGDFELFFVVVVAVVDHEGLM